LAAITLGLADRGVLIDGRRRLVQGPILSVMLSA
jgi:hypothetical protein